VLTMNTRAATLLRRYRQQRDSHCQRRHGDRSASRHRSPDRRSACPASGRRQEPVLIPDLGRKTGAAGDSRDPPARPPGDRGTSEQAFGRLGTASAARPHVSARLSRRHGKGGRTSPPLPARQGASRPLWLQRPCRCRNGGPGPRIEGSRANANLLTSFRASRIESA